MSKVQIKTLLEQAPNISISDLIEPLPERIAAPDFPIDALGEILGEAAKRMAYHIQTGQGLAGQSVLAAASLVAQAHISVQRGVIGIGPVSLFCLSIAESGDRKSTLDRLALEPIRAYEAEQRDNLAVEQKRYAAQLETWLMQRDSIINNAKPKKGAAKEMTDMQREELANKLNCHEDKKPQAPLRPNITFSEPTAEGIWHHFIEGQPTAGLFSDEGISFFGGHGMTAEARGRMIAMLSKFWDGDPITRTRGSQGESGTLAGCRLSTHLMVQPIIAHHVLSDPLFQGQGFLARFLICNEKSIAGTRLLGDRDISNGVNNDLLINRYWQHLNSLLKKPFPTDFNSTQLKPTIMKLKDEVLDAWVALHDGIEKEIAFGGRYESIKPFASKAAEHAARITAIFAFIEGYEQPIVDHVDRAAKIISYYLELMIIYVQNTIQEENDFLAGDLLAWIKKHNGKISSDDFQKLSPVSIRSAKKARQLLKHLVNQGHLQVAQYGRNKVARAWEIINHD